MRHSQSYKRDRTTIGSHHSRKQSGEQQGIVAGTPRVEPEITGIIVAKREEVEGLHHEQTEHECRQRDGDIERQKRRGDAIQTAHSPQHERAYALFGGADDDR